MDNGAERYGPIWATADLRMLSPTPTTFVCSHLCVSHLCVHICVFTFVCFTFVCFTFVCSPLCVHLCVFTFEQQLIWGGCYLQLPPRLLSFPFLPQLLILTPCTCNAKSSRQYSVLILTVKLSPTPTKAALGPFSILYLSAGTSTSNTCTSIPILTVKLSPTPTTFVCSLSSGQLRNLDGTSGKQPGLPDDEESLKWTKTKELNIATFMRDHQNIVLFGRGAVSVWIVLNANFIYWSHIFKCVVIAWFSFLETAKENQNLKLKLIVQLRFIETDCSVEIHAAVKHSFLSGILKSANPLLVAWMTSRRKQSMETHSQAAQMNEKQKKTINGNLKK